MTIKFSALLRCANASTAAQPRGANVLLVHAALDDEVCLHTRQIRIAAGVGRVGFINEMLARLQGLTIRD